MFDYLIRRLLMVIPTFFGITIVTFTIISLAPGDPAELRAMGSETGETDRSDDTLQKMRERFHLDEPIHVRYWIWVSDLVQLDFGKSMADDKPVKDKILEGLWPTVSVNLAALALAFIISVPIGTLAAARRNGVFDRVSGIVLYMFYSIPSYVGAIALILYFGVKYNFLPFSSMETHPDLFGKTGIWTLDLVHGLPAPWDRWLDIVMHMTLYVICVAYGSLAYYSRFVRQNLLEVLQQDYIRTAKAKGLSARTVVLKHGFRNTLIPFLTLIGLVLPGLIGGSVILERIFTWPGLGRLFVDSIFQRDYTTVMALSTATAVLVLLVTLIVDLLYGVVDPRVSHR